MQERNSVSPFEVKLDPRDVLGQTTRFRISGDSWAQALAQALIAVRSSSQNFEGYERQELQDSLIVASSYDRFLRNVREAEMISQTDTKPVSELPNLFPVEQQFNMVAQNYENQAIRRELIEKDPLGVELLEYCIYQEFERAAKRDRSGILRRMTVEYQFKLEEITDPRLIGYLQAFEHYVNMMNLIKDNLDKADKAIAEI